MSNTDKSQKQDIPFEISEQLHKLAMQLPEAARSPFVKGAVARLTGIAKEYPRTLVFTAAGWVMGEIIDNLLSVDVPFSDIVLCLTADKASDLGAVAGAAYGIFEESQQIAERRRVNKIIGEELRKAHATVIS